MDSTRQGEGWTSETIQKFVNSASKEEVAALQVTFKLQADLMRRHGKEESAAFWDGLANGVAFAANRELAGESLPRKDVGETAAHGGA